MSNTSKTLVACCANCAHWVTHDPAGESPPTLPYGMERYCAAQWMDRIKAGVSLGDHVCDQHDFAAHIRERELEGA